MITGLCIFCFEYPGSPPWVVGNPGAGCTYGLFHEYETPVVQALAVRVRDKALCLTCGLHPKNPAASKNGCQHQYEAS